MNDNHASSVVQRLRPRRSRLDNYSYNPSSSSSLSSLLLSSNPTSNDAIVEYLQSVYYGEEQCDIEETDISTLPWNIQWRLWLLWHKKNKTKQRYPNIRAETTFLMNSILPHILVQLQSQQEKIGLLFHEDQRPQHNNDPTIHGSTNTNIITDFMDIIDIIPHTNEPLFSGENSNNNNNNYYGCWQRDKMLVFWKQHQRYHVVKDLERIWTATHSDIFTPSDRRCMTEIVQIIDQITGYDNDSNNKNNNPGNQKHAVHSETKRNTNTNKKIAAQAHCKDKGTGEDTSRSAYEDDVVVRIIQSYQEEKRETQSQPTSQHKNHTSDHIIAMATTPPPYTTTDHRHAFSFDTSSIFRQWIVSQWMKQDVEKRNNVLGNICYNVGIHGSQGQCFQEFARSVDSKMNQEPPAARVCWNDVIPWLATIEPNDEDVMVRGKALCLYVFMYRELIPLGQLPSNGSYNSSNNNNNNNQDNNSNNTWQRIILPRTNDIQLLNTAIDSYLTGQPRQTGFTPNLSELVIELWDTIVTTPLIVVAPSVLLQVVERVRLWLPVDPLIPKIRTKLVEDFSITIPEHESTEHGYYPMNFSGTTAEAFPSENKVKDQCLTLQYAVRFTSICCRDSARNFWMRVVDDTVLYDSILPLYFGQSFLIMGHTTIAEDILPAFRRPTKNFVAFLQSLREQSEDEFDLFMQATPGTSFVLDMLGSLEVPDELHSDADIVNNREQLIRLCNATKNARIDGNDDAGLVLTKFCVALVKFCQGRQHLSSDDWCLHIVKVCARQLWKSNRGDFSHAWVSALFQELCKLQEGHCLVSKLTQRLHELLMEYLLADIEQNVCLSDIVVSEIVHRKDDLPSSISDVVDFVVRSCLPKYLFIGCHGSELEKSLHRALSACNEFELLAQTVRHFVIGAALRGNDPSYQNTEGLSICKSVIRDYFLEGAQEDFHRVKGQITSELESMQLGHCLEWWDEVCQEVRACSDRDNIQSASVLQRTVNYKKRSVEAVGVPSEDYRQGADLSSVVRRRLGESRTSKHNGKCLQSLQTFGPKSPTIEDNGPLLADDSDSIENCHDDSSNDEILLLNLE